MKHAYATNMEPPGMTLFLSVGTNDGPFLFTVEAKLDTGADMTALPQELLKKFGIGPTPGSRVLVGGAFDQEGKERPTFFVKVQLGTGPVLDVEALATPKRRALLGRDILNEFILLADGPQELFELSFGNLSI